MRSLECALRVYNDVDHKQFYFWDRSGTNTARSLCVIKNGTSTSNQITEDPGMRVSRNIDFLVESMEKLEKTVDEIGTNQSGALEVLHDRLTDVHVEAISLGNQVQVLKSSVEIKLTEIKNLVDSDAQNVIKVVKNESQELLRAISQLSAKLGNRADNIGVSEKQIQTIYESSSLWLYSFVIIAVLALVTGVLFVFRKQVIPRRFSNRLSEYRRQRNDDVVSVTESGI